MPISTPIPTTAPFAPDEIDILNRVVGPATPTQRAWLAGFLAGLDASSAGQSAAVQTSAPPRAAEPLAIVFATESGNSEQLAAEVAKSARKKGFKPSVYDLADLDLADLAKTKRLIVIAATWGEGEPPGRAVNAYADLMSDEAPRLDGVEFGVLALGDTAYVQFCAIGKSIDERLEALGGKRVIERVECDLDFAAPATDFLARALDALAPPEPKGKAAGQVIPVDFSSRPATSVDTSIVTAEINDLINLNSSRSDKQTFHIELGFDPAVPAYEPGDAFDVFAENDPDYVDALLKAANITDDELRHDFIVNRDVTTLSLKTMQDYVAATGHQYVKPLLETGAAREWIVGRQLIDLIAEYPVALDAETLRKLTRPLPPRAYSIASSRAEVGEEAHLLVAPVHYETHGRARAGVASTYLAERVKKGGSVRVKLKPNKHFRLPAADRDIIMVGPGTGVAPFRAFVQERRATGATGKAWLFFGDRRYTHDFLYQLEWQDALKDGSLTRADLAFSRDTPAKIYVQHKLHERRRDLIDWLERGAHFYVCGDAKAMAKDVRAGLVTAFAEVKNISGEAAEDAVRMLEREHRYQQDVY